MNFRLLLAIVAHDLRVFVSDRRTVVLSLLVPIGVASFFATIFADRGPSEKKTKITLAVADSDRSETSAAIVEKLTKNALLKVVDSTEAGARELVLKGNAPAALLIPAGFGAAAANGAFSSVKANLTLLKDPSKTSEAQLVRGLVLEQSASTVMSRSFRSDPKSLDNQLALVKASPTLSFEQKSALSDTFSGLKRWNKSSPPNAGAGANAGGGNASMPVVLTDEAVTARKIPDAGRDVGAVHAFVGMAVQGLLFFAIDFAMGILRERRTGVLRRLRAAPVARTSLLTGKLLASSLCGLVILATVFSVGALFFRLRIHGSFAGFALLAVTSSITVASLGLLIASFGKTESQARAASVPVILGMSILGGAWFPTFMMPSWVRSVSAVIPSRWAIDGFDAMTWRGLPFADAAAPAGILLVFAAVFTAIAFARFRWE